MEELKMLEVLVSTNKKVDELAKEKEQELI